MDLGKVHVDFSNSTYSANLAPINNRQSELRS